LIISVNFLLYGEENNMDCKYGKYILGGLLALILLCGSIILPTGGYAQGPYKGEWILPQHYPNGFDGWGRIDRLASDEIVIDDTLYKLSPSVTYNTSAGTNVSMSLCGIGNVVGYLQSTEGEIISLWRIPG
jgi:hypothetical protein